MATKLITFAGGHELWDGHVAEVAAEGRGYAERSAEGVIYCYHDSGESEEIEVEEKLREGRVRLKKRRVSIYRFVGTRLVNGDSVELRPDDGGS